VAPFSAPRRPTTKDECNGAGTVKFFNADKGYGFIAPEDGGPDVFLRATALEAAGMRSVLEGDRLSFDAVMNQRKGKTNAQNIKKLG
jgi:CspA family cold shock protein